jgi:hypothetical protein
LRNGTYFWRQFDCRCKIEYQICPTENGIDWDKEEQEMNYEYGTETGWKNQQKHGARLCDFSNYSQFGTDIHFWPQFHCQLNVKSIQHTKKFHRLQQNGAKNELSVLIRE